MQTMNTSFWESNLFQTLVLIVTVGATIGIALWQFHCARHFKSPSLLKMNTLQEFIS